MDPATIQQRVRAQLAEQRELVASLLELREQLQGSFFARYGECGKETCACRSGAKHGPYYVLSTRSGGKGGFSYVDAEHAEEARLLVTRHRQFKAGLRRLQKLNAAIVELLRRYQALVARRAHKRLGIAPAG